jgi:hypothetical protein
MFSINKAESIIKPAGMHKYTKLQYEIVADIKKRKKLSTDSARYYATT